MRDPLGRLFPNLPRDVRVVLDWVLTIAGRDRDRARAQAVGRQSVPDPVVVDGADAPLRAARARLRSADFSDRVLANRFIYHFRNPKRGEIIVFNTPPEAKVRCGAGGTFVKRLIGLPGDTVSERDGYRRTSTASSSSEPYIQPTRRDHEPTAHLDHVPNGLLLLHGRQPRAVVRLARLGIGAAEEPDRRGLLRLLAAEPDRFSLT